VLLDAIQRADRIANLLPTAATAGSHTAVEGKRSDPSRGGAFK
jgi:hypothetical protein